MKPRHQILLTSLVLILNYGLDRITKLLAVNYLKGTGPISFIHNTVVLSYAENRGAFLSAGSQWPDVLKYALLLLLPILLCLFGIYYCAFRLTDKRQIIAYACIIGGGLGNLIDRLLNNFTVVDFLIFGIGSLRTGILNVADMSVTFGVLYLIAFSLLHKKSLTT